jgi:hypothetical protein
MCQFLGQHFGGVDFSINWNRKVSWTAVPLGGGVAVHAIEFTIFVRVETMFCPKPSVNDPDVT